MAEAEVVAVEDAVVVVVFNAVVVVVVFAADVVVTKERLWTLTFTSALISGSSSLVTVTVQVPSETP